MPYTIRKGNGCPPSKPWGVFKEGTNERMGCHETKEGAQQQIGAIESEERRNT